MVVFTCNHCGDSLQKPKVEKHCSFVCRAPKSLTCIDCLKDFRGEEYVSHTKCLTEEERYAAKGTFANGIIKKGEVKQESWIEMIKSIIDKEPNLKPSIRNLLNTISNYNNVPRKKPKFVNFIKSSSGGRANMNDVEEVWNIIEKYKAGQQKSTNNNSESCQNGISEEKLANNADAKMQTSDKDSNNTEGNNKKKKKAKQELNGNTPKVEQLNETDTSNGENLKKSKKKKRQLEDEEIHLETEKAEVNVTHENNEGSIKKKTKKKKLHDEEIEQLHVKKPKLDIENVQEMETTQNFDFCQKILEILASKGSISKNKLEKKVISAYLKHSGLSESSPKILKKFNKKLKKIDNIEIVDTRISLKTQ